MLPVPATAVFTAPGVDPTDRLRTAFLLHGILGSKQNWRGFARRLAARLPGWRLVTVDHRNHGQTEALPGPHTVEACAADLARLAAHLGCTPEVIVGHSFGGKVALAYTRDHGAALAQTWVLDALPGDDPDALTGDNEVYRVISALRAVPMPLGRRERIVEILESKGFAPGLARWMTTNLQKGPDGFTWRFDLDGAREMIEDYFRLDLWPVVEQPRIQPELHLVRAERSDRWSPAVVARLEAPPPGAPTHLHLLPDAGHWVHADNPQGLLDLMEEWWAI